jgi:CBS domain-containing protein
MSAVKETITPDMDLLAVASIFLQNFFSCLPVQEGGKLVGVIHRLDVLRGIAEWERRLEADREEHERAGMRPSSIEEMQRVVGTHTKDQVVERFKKD